MVQPLAQEMGEKGFSSDPQAEEIRTLTSHSQRALSELDIDHPTLHSSSWNWATK